MKSYSVFAIVALVTFSSACNPDDPDSDATIIKESTTLKGFWSFEKASVNLVADENGEGNEVRYDLGISGDAYKGDSNSYVAYSNLEKIASMTSFSLSFWLNTSKHAVGDQCVFMLSDDAERNGRMGLFIKPNSDPNENSMSALFKFGNQSVEFSGRNRPDGLNRWPNAYNQWMHVAFTYDETESTFAAFLNGQPITLDASVIKRFEDNIPLGALDLTNTTKFIIGGFQQAIGIRPPKERWMQNYTGMLDQFRIYSRALKSSEVNDLFLAKK